MVDEEHEGPLLAPEPGALAHDSSAPPPPPPPPPPPVLPPRWRARRGREGVPQAMTGEATETPAALEERRSGQSSPRRSGGCGQGQGSRWT